MKFRCGLITFFFLSASAFADNNCQPWDTQDISKKLFVGEINLSVNDIFDAEKKDENKWIHQRANSLHETTKPEVIKRQLLFKEGDVFDLALLEETERLIRNNRYIKDAEVQPKEVCGNLVNIDVRTVDHWTLDVGVSVGRSGGENKSGFEIKEHNLFGLGKSLSIGYKSDDQRSGTQLFYEDEQLFGSRKRLALAAEKNSDGSVYVLDLGLPFFSLHAPTSWGIGAGHKRQKTSLYDQGNVVDTFDDDLQTAYMFYGWANEPEGNSVQRYRLGWNYSEDRFASDNDSSEATEITQSYPWFEYAFNENEYLKLENLNTMGVTEDAQIGKGLSMNVGLLNTAFGSDDNYLRFGGGYSKGYHFTEKQLGTVRFAGNSYLGNGDLQGFQSYLNGQYYYFRNKKNTLYFSGKLRAADNLLSKQQFELGGEEGLRGYPQGFQTGDRSVLLTMEYRHYFDFYPWKLAKFGAVAFADAGTAWDSDTDPDILTDVGFGLRVVPTHSSSSKVFHFDVAFPLNENNQVDSVQYLLSTKNSF